MQERGDVGHACEPMDSHILLEANQVISVNRESEQESYERIVLVEEQDLDKKETYDEVSYRKHIGSAWKLHG
jgi:hypothetical protein